MKIWNRRSRTVVLGAVPVAAVMSLLTLPTVPGTDIDLTVPYAAEGPGPTFDTLGQAEGRPVVDIVGAEQDKTSGHLNMTTVSVRTKMTLAQAMSRWLFTEDTLVPIEQVFPAGKSPQQVQKDNEQAFANSESNATIAAMSYLRRPLETMVIKTSESSPAASVMNVNDVITSVNDKKVTLPSDVAAAVREHAPGDTVTVTVDRRGKSVSFPVTLAETPEEFRQGREKSAFLGVTTVAQPAGGLRVEYNLADIGGPSAGLMFSLAVVDKLSPGELTGGRFIAGTGTIDAEGKVGPIGGITHKIQAAKDAGASAFLVPADNCAEAVQEGEKGIELIKVDSLSDAVGDLKDLDGGKQPSHCE
ncbi:PDZ domain-containing protein [Corynebacterium heidelbergense]|uniref:endopeptidase La n=2 Tax=Corynebacterium heidelbergense TaxID=2055947 RepID=A0A364VAB2_9CORY|nr:PDZ domain-containing protein [Corynebacterium heidelbergense]